MTKMEQLQAFATALVEKLATYGDRFRVPDRRVDYQHENYGRPGHTEGVQLDWYYVVPINAHVEVDEETGVIAAEFSFWEYYNGHAAQIAGFTITELTDKQLRPVYDLFEKYYGVHPTLCSATENNKRRLEVLCLLETANSKLRTLIGQVEDAATEQGAECFSLSAEFPMFQDLLVEAYEMGRALPLRGAKRG